MSSSDRCVKAVVTARRVNAKETFQDMSGELIENRGYFWNGHPFMLFRKLHIDCDWRDEVARYGDFRQPLPFYLQHEGHAWDISNSKKGKMGASIYFDRGRVAGNLHFLTGGGLGVVETVFETLWLWQERGYDWCWCWLNLVLRLKTLLPEDTCANIDTWYPVTNQAIYQPERLQNSEKDDRRKFGTIASTMTSRTDRDNTLGVALGRT